MQKDDDNARANARNNAIHNRSYYLGGLDTIVETARDVGKPFGMAPPSVYEELDYAWQFVSLLDERRDHDSAQILADRIEEAQKWDHGAIMSIRDMFSDGLAQFRDDVVSFRDQFGRDGIYPITADINDREYTYTSRWQRARHIDKLSQLPMFGEKDVIRNSTATMQYDCKTLVLRQDELTPDYRKPENLLWTPHYDENGECHGLNNEPESRFKVENMITGLVVTLRRRDFEGVLRPEHNDNISFESLKQEYSQSRTESEDEQDESIGFEGFEGFEGFSEYEDEEWDGDDEI